MKALLFKGIGKIALEEVPDPKIKDTTDAIIKLTMSTICGTDLHMVRGTMQGMEAGTILGHEGVGVVIQIGKDVHKFKIGDRVIIPSTVGCGSCKNCKLHNYSQCDHANPNGPESGTVFYGGPKASGPLNGMQAEKVRVPFADANLIKIPHNVSDDQVILLSDILPTAYMAVENAHLKPTDTVAVFGCGPVGQLVILCLKNAGIKDIYAIDRIPARLKMAQDQGVTVINFDEKDPVKELKALTNQKGPDKIIDAVGIDAEQPKSGFFGFFKNSKHKKQFRRELKDIAPKTNVKNGNWKPGNGPSQVFQWAAKAIAKNGIISIIGVYPETLRFFPIGEIFEKNITVTMGNCNHYKYIPQFLDSIQHHKLDLTQFITQRMSFSDVITAYREFDKRNDNYIKIALIFD